MISTLKESCSKQRQQRWANASVETLKKSFNNYDSLEKMTVGNDSTKITLSTWRRSAKFSDGLPMVMDDTNTKLCMVWKT